MFINNQPMMPSMITNQPMQQFPQMGMGGVPAMQPMYVQQQPMMPMAPPPSGNMLQAAASNALKSFIFNKVVSDFGLNANQAQMLVNMYNASEQNILNGFVQRCVNQQTGQYDPNQLNSWLYESLKSLISRVSGGNTGVMMPNQMASGMNYMISGYGTDDKSTMNYHNVGAVPQQGNINNPGVPDNPELRTAALQQRGVYTGQNVGEPQKIEVPQNVNTPSVFNNNNTGSTPVVQEAYEMEEVEKGNFTCGVNTLIEQDPTPEELQYKEITTIPKVQDCVKICTFRGERDNAEFPYTHIRLYPPYSNVINALMDYDTAYSELNDKVNTTDLFEIYQMIPIGVNYDILTPILNEIKTSLKNNIWSITTVLNKINHDNVRIYYTESIIQLINKLLITYLSRGDSKGVVKHLAIEELADLLLIHNHDSSLESTLKPFTCIDGFDERFEECVKTALDCFFFIKDDNRPPYLDMMSNELTYIAATEFSGIRVDDNIGRQYSFIAETEHDEAIMKSVAKKLKVNTLLIRKHYILRTFLDYPEIKRLNSNNGKYCFNNERVPIHFILKSIIAKQGVIPMLLFDQGAPTDIYLGVSLNSFTTLAR